MIYNIYLICAEINDNKLYKIGYTRRKIEKRIKEIKTGNGADIYLVESFQSKWGSKLEALLKNKYKYSNINREWFYLTDSEVKGFKNSCKTIEDNLTILSKENLFVIEKKIL